MLNKKCNVGVIGLGNMGQHHAKAYTKLDNVNFVVACDHNLDRFNAIIKEPDTRYVDSVDQLSGMDIDAISVCVPTNQHFSVVMQCLDYGFSVLVEKPITDDVDTANKLISYAESKGLWLTVGHIERFNPAIVKAKACIDDGLIGNLRSIQCKRYGPFPKQIKDSNVLVDVAVHDIDIVQYFIGEDITDSKVFHQYIHSKDRADFAQLYLKFGDDITVNIFSSWAFPFKKREIEVVGEKGILNIDCLNQTVDFYPVNVEKYSDNLSLLLANKQVLPINKKEPIIEECRAFVDSVQHNVAPFISPREAMSSLSLVLSTPQVI